MHWKKQIVIGLIAVLCFGLVACSPEKSKEKEVTVVLDWTPNTNHTGLYVAQAKKYFQEAGLKVRIIQPGKSTAEQLVASGKADFGVSYQEGVTQARVVGVPIVSIAAVIQHNTSGFASLSTSGIVSPKDMEGKEYGGFGSPVEKAMIQSLMKKENGDINKVKITNIGSTDFLTALKQGIDFYWIYYGWQGVEAEQKGLKLNMIYLSDQAKELDYYTPVLITSESKIKQESSTVKSFMQAVSKGYQFAIDHPDEAADILVKQNPSLDSKLVHQSQKWLSSRYQADAKSWGVQKESVWSGYANWMKSHQLLDGQFDPKKAFTNDFIPQGGK
ncbi:ABC transporter substrate-binding protein [Shimazuella alba]|uniref:ABC transporter substrate-binding protein n=1 Tax=Shimazuella alba TaxID=2690964 RepID=A0A6I4VYU0_9BACL|nr:ABC transporter substrate-binding protein [Shimazuella alba]MXQ55115.1 ABC transporter substrate-binding protein [Shimazuella alba]